MLIHVRHATRYSYDQPTFHSVQRLHLAPRNHEGQRVVEWTIELPDAARSLPYDDAFGNRVHLVTLMGEHEGLEIVARGMVERVDTAGIVRDPTRSMPDAVFLRQTGFTATSPAIKTLAKGLGSSPGLEGLHRLMGEVRDRIDYQVGATHAHTTASEALAEGRGVCQDHAHVFISACRHAGIPSRYVSGYLVIEDGTPGEAGHAWAEALVPDLGWVGFDVANRICPTERYVRVACGLDALMVAPVRGTRRGGGAERLDVEVIVAEEAPQ